MTIQELYTKLRPTKTEEMSAQLLSDGLSVNFSDMFTTLIRDAARCNSYSSDVFYDLTTIYDAFKDFRANTVFQPIFVGFRRYGVDSNSFILSRIGEDTYSLHREYFALYSVMVKPDSCGWYKVLFNYYAM